MSFILATLFLSPLAKKLPQVVQEDFKFLDGKWTAKIWEGDFEEVWTAPKGNVITQMSRHTKDGKLTFMEFGSIEQTVNGDWTMFIIFGKFGKGDKKPIGFKLAEAKPGDVLFVNTTNDFPTHIRYTAKKKTEMTCVIYGRADGKKQSETFNFKRLK